MGACAQVALGQKPSLKVFGQSHAARDGTAGRDFVHVTDAVNATLMAISHLEKPGCQLFNCGTGRCFFVMDVVQVFEGLTSKTINLDMGGQRLGGPAVQLQTTAAFEGRWVA